MLVLIRVHYVSGEELRALHGTVPVTFRREHPEGMLADCIGRATFRRAADSCADYSHVIVRGHGNARD